MIKKDFVIYTKKLMKELRPYLLKECIRLYESGGINTEDYIQNFVLPTIIFKVALENNAKQYIVREDCKRDYKNLQHF